MASDLAVIFTLSVDRLAAKVGDRDRAATYLTDALAVTCNPIEQLYLTYKLRFLIQYLQDGSRVSEKELDSLATDAVRRTLLTFENTTAKELGL